MTIVTYSATGSLPDDPGSAPTVRCSPASGIPFPSGPTTVNCTASDQTTPPDVATGRFQVEVKGTFRSAQVFPGWQ
ncbi:hypothetical protein [Dictyobacter aurantiacus]|uniref:HYR domain-containing protein n=1 Tax=Dictyobacter aurantiacus TaxID=1936993 RepID=A0A401ZND0_9CHLR|nr:hypothetical protein [Dictyobacter aurantiacus]GCE08266.1 hypothetical protein KDAU_55950 [Dictyobacter aurantiacus]